MKNYSIDYLKDRKAKMQEAYDDLVINGEIDVNAEVSVALIVKIKDFESSIKKLEAFEQIERMNLFLKLSLFALCIWISFLIF